MPAVVRYVPNPVATTLLRKSTGVTVQMARYAAQLSTAAKGFAPILTGAYRDGIHAEVDPDVGARVVASDYKSVWIEFGTGEPGPTPAFAPLRRAAEELGLALVAEGHSPPLAKNLISLLYRQ